jgi:hypothetical protein
VVKDVDDRILEVFTSAFEDTAREFQSVFQVLFPGGEGRLVLTDPEDMLTTGVEVEARPPGKKIKRLSLLSGGERSLTSVAMLVRDLPGPAQPVLHLDEVEAALDDVNLGRLITLFQQLREKSQLLIITHQKRTMEVADALYGVTMRAGVHAGDQPAAQPRTGGLATSMRRQPAGPCSSTWTACYVAGIRPCRRPSSGRTACLPGTLLGTAMAWDLYRPAVAGELTDAEWMRRRRGAAAAAARSGRRSRGRVAAASRRG